MCCYLVVLSRTQRDESLKMPYQENSVNEGIFSDVWIVVAFHLSCFEALSFDVAKTENVA